MEWPSDLDLNCPPVSPPHVTVVSPIWGPPTSADIHSTVDSSVVRPLSPAHAPLSTTTGDGEVRPSESHAAATSAFLEELTAPTDTPTDIRVSEESASWRTSQQPPFGPEEGTGKRKREALLPYDSDDLGSGHGAKRTQVQIEERRTIDRYYDHHLTDGHDEHGGEHPSQGWRALLPNADGREPDGFEVVSFQLFCPLSRLKLNRKTQEGIRVELGKRTMIFRIHRQFEREGEGPCVLLDSGEPKPVRSEHEIRSEGVALDWDKREAVFSWNEQGFRFRDMLEFSVYFPYNPGLKRDLLEEHVFDAALLISPDNARFPISRSVENYYLSNPQFAHFYWDSHCYEIQGCTQEQSEDPQSTVRLTFKGRFLVDFMELAKLRVPITATSDIAGGAEDEDEIEE